MMTWLRHWATSCHGISFIRMKTVEKIQMGKLPTFSLIIALLIGVGCAFLSTWLPNITTLFFGTPRRQWLTADPKSGFHLQLTDVQLHAPSKLKVNRDVNGESQAAVNLAKEMMLQRKLEKAHKLFQHAVALDPDHPDVLNELGEFLEKTQKDIVLAEHMYTKAITVNPTHSKALINRKRTLPLVEEIDQNTFNRIEKKREEFFKVPENSPAMKRMKKESYFSHIYHTNAIEGNTFTLSQTRALVETRIAIGGKSIMEHNEILGMDCALSFINNTLVYRIGSMTVADILEIHKRVLGFVDPLEAGKFRNHQVFVGEHVPPAASDVEMLMDEFVEWLNSEDALNLNPIELAALAHYRLVYIHPFYDGNGRTSRLLMNLILMRAGYPPVIIRKEEKHEYYKHLESGNKGDVRPFIRFIAKCTERMLDEYLWATSDKPNNTLVSLSGYRDDGRTIIVDRP